MTRLTTIFDGVEKERIAQILLGISHLVGADGVEFGYRQTQFVKMPRHIDEGAVLIAVRAFHTDDRTALLIRHTGIHPVAALLLNHDRN